MSHRISSTYNLCYLQCNITLHCKFFIEACDFVAVDDAAFCFSFNIWGKALCLKEHCSLETDAEKPPKTNKQNSKKILASPCLIQVLMDSSQFRADKPYNCCSKMECYNHISRVAYIYKGKDLTHFSVSARIEQPLT